MDQSQSSVSLHQMRRERYLENLAGGWGSAVRLYTRLCIRVYPCSCVCLPRSGCFSLCVRQVWVRVWRVAWSWSRRWWCPGSGVSGGVSRADPCPGLSPPCPQRRRRHLLSGPQEEAQKADRRGRQAQRLRLPQCQTGPCSGAAVW